MKLDTDTKIGVAKSDAMAFQEFLGMLGSSLTRQPSSAFSA